MRINKFLALATGHSRRAIDALIQTGSVRVNGHVSAMGQDIKATDTVTIDNKPVKAPKITTIVLNKPVGYVCSRDGQGSQTVYNLLPEQYHHLKPVGRLDKDSSGLLLLTNDGDLAYQLTHPSFEKEKVYLVSVKPSLLAKDKQKIETGVQLDDGISKLTLIKRGGKWQVIMHEGRNRQIRRTFAILNYKVIDLHRIKFGQYKLEDLPSATYKEIR